MFVRQAGYWPALDAVPEQQVRKNRATDGLFIELGAGVPQIPLDQNSEAPRFRRPWPVACRALAPTTGQQVVRSWPS
jgi:hypothetical protein